MVINLISLNMHFDHLRSNSATVHAEECDGQFVIGYYRGDRLTEAKGKLCCGRSALEKQRKYRATEAHLAGSSVSSRSRSGCEFGPRLGASEKVTNQ